MKRFFSGNKLIIFYGLGLAAAVIFLRWVEVQFLVFQHKVEIYAVVIAISFTVLGIWLARKLTAPKTEMIIVEKEVARQTGPDPEAIAASELSKRELEVLQLMANGLSNQEIADQLFVSLNTVKTHAAKVMEKLDVKRRTQAVEKARQLRLIAT